MYLLQGSLNIKPGHLEEIKILQDASKIIKANNPECKLYAIATSEGQSDKVFVTEIWQNKTSHDQSLQNDKVKQLITNAMPLLDGQPDRGQELTIIGGIY